MQDHQLALKPGYVLEGFRIERVLGKGGFGITYLAVDVRLGKKVAIKELLPDSIATRVEGSTVLPQSSSQKEDWEWAKERFVEEARMLAGFSHPAIVGVHSLIEANSTAYMVMDYIDGESYEAKLKRIGTESDEAALMAVIGPVLEGLEQVHQRGLLHRDIKPENILIKRNGQPVLIDFGAARESVGQTVTMTSMVTHGYSPIEQYQSKGRMGPWTDLYAVGALMCRAMTGEKPPVAANRVMDEEFEWLSYRDLPGYSAEFRQTVDWALRVKPQERPQSVADFSSELRRRVWADTRDRHASHAASETNVDQHDVSVGGDAGDSHSASLASTETSKQAGSGSDPDPVLGGTTAVKRLVKAFAALCLLALVVALAIASIDNVKQDVDAVQSSQLEDNLQRFSPTAGSKIHVPKDYPTITAALNAAREGQTVIVAPGIYEECIKMKSGISLEGIERDTTIIRNREIPDAVVAASGISSATLSNLTIEQLLEQTSAGHRYDSVSIENSTITMRNCNVRGSGRGVDITGSGNPVVSECRIEGCEVGGIRVQANTGQPVLRGNNCVGNKGVGIVIGKGGWADLSANNCLGNELYGILVHSGGRAKAVGNTCNGNEEDGIAVGYSGQADLLDNKCQENKKSGILVWNGGRAKAVGNTCNRNGDSGIVVNSGQADLSDNTCSENKAFGILFAVGSEGKVEGNRCDKNGYSGLAFRGSSTQVDIVRNFANGNGGNGIAVETVVRLRSFDSNYASGNQWEPQINRSATWND